jgi:hypothetical protein
MKCPHCKTELELRIVTEPPKAVVKPVKDDIGELLIQVEQHRGEFNDWETEFVDGIIERYDKYKEKIYLSDKQIASLKKIAEKGF